ncbi:MAG: formyltetrahydrofolate deformylase [Cytophagaceae bacterium]|jgi:formyltetrahydrofolate deformylase|nr:formyltetrahydrofolate deformylase [Cytophagaceae bacterium]
MITIIIDCADAKGLIYKITGVIAHLQLNITANREFVEKEKNRFYMRTCVDGDIQIDVLEAALKNVLPEDHTLILHTGRLKRLVVMVTKEEHCLTELISRYYFGNLKADILAVVGNHNHLKNYTEKFSIPYHYISHEGKSREEHEKEILDCIQSYQPDYIVLAKYMRILSESFTNHFQNKMINIHHSFLPAFKGANPYRQAYERGVKIIGATAHFVNQDLDEGPIICQEVLSVDHSLSSQDMSSAGKDVEKMVLAKAIQLVVEDRVYVTDNKTIVF